MVTFPFFMQHLCSSVPQTSTIPMDNSVTDSPKLGKKHPSP